MTMADMMYSHSPLCPEDCECIAIAHCNFGLRPGDCDADEVLVREWAEQRGIPFRSIHFDTLGYAREHRCGIEVAAREQRYRWFAELCEELGCDGVATAHHADDNLETLLLNLLRGTGLKGICGMCGTDRLPYQREDGKLLLIRPLLRLSREDIREYALSHGVPWREDLSNGEDCYRRNFLRNRVIPLLRELNPSLSTVIADDMENFRIAELALADWEREEKSLGSYCKSGSGTIQKLITPAERPPRCGGLYMMDVVPDGEPLWGFPNISDNAEIMEMIASGCHIILYTTGRGSVAGSAISPVIKVCSNPDTFRRMEEDMDINAGKIITEGASFDDIASEIINLITDIADGKQTKSEALGHREYYIGYKHFDNR